MARRGPPPRDTRPQLRPWRADPVHDNFGLGRMPGDGKGAGAQVNWEGQKGWLAYAIRQERFSRFRQRA